MYLRVAICNDDANNIISLQKHLEQFELEYDIDFKMSLFTSGEKLLSQYNTSENYHLIFLGIEMPGINGIETASAIRSSGDYEIKIIFASNYSTYMQESFDVQPFHYLQKPLAYSTFCKLMQRIIILYKNTKTIKYVIQHDKTEELVNINDILYIESVKSQKGLLHFALKNREIYTKGILKELNGELTEYDFVTTCRGFLVNMRYIHCINKNSITLTTGVEIPPSRRCDQEIRNLFAKHVIIFHNH